MSIPTPKYFAGIDPGAKGAIGLINAAGTSVHVWPMPMLGGEIDLPGIKKIFSDLVHFPDVHLGIEWPNAWPGAFNNVIRDAEVFGRQKGILEAFAYIYCKSYVRVPPQSWKGKLGLDGKQHEGAVAAAAGLWDAQYPAATAMIRGPRGGVLDGPLDALLIAHFLRLKSGAIANTAVRGSVEHLAAVLSMGKGKRKLCRMPKKEFS